MHCVNQPIQWTDVLFHMTNVRVKTLIIVGLSINILTLLYIYNTQQPCRETRTQVTQNGLHHFNSIKHDQSQIHSAIQNHTNKYKNLLTLVIYDFEDFCNDVPNVVKTALRVMPEIKVTIVGEKQFYPPITKNHTGYNEFLYHVNVRGTIRDFQPDHIIRSQYVLVAPDGVNIGSRKIIMEAVNNLRGCYPKCHAVAIHIDDVLQCYSANLSIKTWTLRFKSKIQILRNNTKVPSICDYVKGSHAVLMMRDDYVNLPTPFLRPFPDALYIYFTTRRWKTYIYRQKMTQNTKIFAEQTFLWKHREESAERRKDMLHILGIKLIIHNDARKEWHGCTKHTNRCFGTVLNDVPEFIHEKKLTPPCCLKALRLTAHHVFRILDNLKVRYWLEGGSLLGAVRNGDIIPWDFDVDIGIYREDIGKVYQLSEATKKVFVDDEDYVWEKAIEGEFYRVQYSAANHMHVDIFPFYVRDGVMTKNTWIKSHRQDCEFPEHFLKPLNRTMFVGYSTSIPNKAHNFLELKFGKGVIENPKYPNGISVQ